MNRKINLSENFINLLCWVCNSILRMYFMSISRNITEIYNAHTWKSSKFRNTRHSIPWIISRAVCSLTGNYLGTEVSCRRCADDMQTTCGWCADDMRVRFHWRFGWQMTYGIQNIIRTSSTGMYVICTSSAELHMVSMDLNYLSTMTETGYWMEFVATMLSCFISGSCKWFAT